MHKKLQIGFMASVYDKTMELLTPETFEGLVTSEKVRGIMSRIEAEPDAEKKNKLKNQLPVVLYACQMPADGKRPKAADALASGFCMHDWDKIPANPREFYMQNIAGYEEALGIVLAHVTPRGEGLRLVTLLKDGEDIIQCQDRLAGQFGMIEYADTKVKDLSRVSFLPSKDYIMYYDENGLFEHEVEASDDVEHAESKAQVTDVVAETKSSTEVMPTEQHEECAKVAENFTYQGIKYSAIIEALLKRIATQGRVKEGERNDDLFILVRELRHICDYKFNTVLMLVAPYFKTLPDAEVRRTINHAIATTGRTITPTLRGVINELKNEDIDSGNQMEVLQLPKLPKLSEVEEMILSKYPKHIRSQVYMAMLPIWGLYGTHIRFNYMDGRENSLSFMTAVVGKSGSGKAFAAHLFDQMTERIRIEDAMERHKADEYRAKCNKASGDTEKPDDPRPRVRIYGDDITTSQFLEYLDNLKGVHGIQFTEEVARLHKSKKSIYNDNDDLYCKAFDNAIGGKESKSSLTRNIRIPIYLNTLFCGTPGAMHKFYNNPEGGLNNRILYAFMPKVRLKGFPKYGNFTKEEKELFDSVCDRLNHAGKDEKKVHLPWLEKTITMIKNRWDKEDDENPDEVWYDLGKRSMVVAMRAGVLEWFLRDCPTDEKKLREISKVVKWVADAMRASVYAFSGNDYEDINEKDNAFQQKHTHQSKNKKLFSLLPEEFTVQDVITLRIQNGDSTNVKMVICRWMADGLILKKSDGCYSKVPELVA